MASLANLEAAQDVSETYQYFVGDSAFYFVVEDGSVEVYDGEIGDATVVLTTDEETWSDIVAGGMPRLVMA